MAIKNVTSNSITSANTNVAMNNMTGNKPTVNPKAVEGLFAAHSMDEESKISFDELDDIFAKAGSKNQKEKEVVGDYLFERYGVIKDLLLSLKEKVQIAEKKEYTMMTSLVNTLMLSVYGTELNQKFVNFKNISNFLIEAISENSDIMILIDDIGDQLKALSQQSIAITDMGVHAITIITKKIIVGKVEELIKIIRELLEKYNIIPNDFKIIDKNDSSGLVQLTSESSRNFINNDKNRYVTTWFSEIKTNVFIGQKASILIKRYENYDGNAIKEKDLSSDKPEDVEVIYVTIPLLDIYEIPHYKKRVEYFFGLLNEDYYYSNYQIEKEEEEYTADNKGQIQYKTEKEERRLYVGSIFEKNDDINDVERGNFKYRTTKKGSWYRGKLNDSFNFLESGVSAVCEFINPSITTKSYPLDKLSDSIIFSKTIITQENNIDIEYVCSGKLNYNQAKSVDRTLEEDLNTTKVSVYEGTITVDNGKTSATGTTSINTLTSRKIIAEIITYTHIPNNNQYLYVYLDPDSTLNQTLGVTSKEMTSKMENIIGYAISSKVRVEQSNVIICDNEVLQIVQILLSFSKINLENNNPDLVHDTGHDYQHDDLNWRRIFVDLTTKLKNAKKISSNSLLREISDMLTIAETTQLTKTVLTTYSDNYSEEYIGKAMSLLLNIQTTINIFLNKSSFDVTSSSIINNMISNLEKDITELFKELSMLISDLYSAAILINEKIIDMRSITDSPLGAKFGLISSVSTFFDILSGTYQMFEIVESSGKKVFTLSLPSLSEYREKMAKYHINDGVYNNLYYVFSTTLYYLQSKGLKTEKFNNTIYKNLYRIIEKTYNQILMTSVRKNYFLLSTLDKQLIEFMLSERRFNMNYGIKITFNPNTQFCNPLLHKASIHLERFDQIDILNLLEHNTSSTFEEKIKLLKQIWYSEILQNIKNIDIWFLKYFQQVYDGKVLITNYRELIELYVLYLVLQEINNDQETFELDLSFFEDILRNNFFGENINLLKEYHRLYNALYLDKDMISYLKKNTPELGNTLGWEDYGE